MTREARRGFRTAASVIHIVSQLIVIYLVIEQGAVLALASGGDIPHAQIRLLQYIGVSLALNALNYSVMKLLSHSHSSYDKR